MDIFEKIIYLSFAISFGIAIGFGWKAELEPLVVGMLGALIYYDGIRK